MFNDAEFGRSFNSAPCLKHILLRCRSVECARRLCGKCMGVEKMSKVDIYV